MAKIPPPSLVTILDVLHNFDDRSGASDDYCRGIINGVMAALLAYNYTFDEAVALCKRHIPANTRIAPVPDCWRDAFGLNVLPAPIDPAGHVAFEVQLTATLRVEVNVAKFREVIDPARLNADYIGGHAVQIISHFDNSGISEEHAGITAHYLDGDVIRVRQIEGSTAPARPKKEEILNFICDKIVELAGGVPVDQIDLYQDVDFTLLSATIEREFQIELSEDEIESIDTPDELAKLVRKKVKEL